MKPKVKIAKIDANRMVKDRAIALSIILLSLAIAILITRGAGF